ncbi:putative cell survival pathways protein [Mitosporidium daphniae]
MTILHSSATNTLTESESFSEDFKGLHNPISLSSLRWVFPKRSTLLQAQNFYLVSDEGDFIFFQIAQTCLPLFSFVQASLRYFSKEKGLNLLLTQTFKFSEWSLSKKENTPNSDFITSSVGPLTVEFMESPTPGFNISYSGSNAVFSVQLQSICAPLTLRDGIVEFQSSKASGSFSFKYAPQFVFTGSIEAEGLPKRPISGMASLNLVTQLIEPHLAASKWCFFYFVAKGKERLTFSLLHFLTTALFHKKDFSQGILTIDGKVIGLTLNNSITFIKQKITEQSGGYALPSQIHLVFDGIGPGGSTDVWRLEAHIPLETCVDRLDLLAHIPYFIRKVIQALLSKPYCFQWFDDIKITLTRQGKPQFYEGKIFSEVLYIC